METGTFSISESADGIATFDSGSINFSIDGDHIVWNSLTYQRVATSQFNSQQSLTDFLDGSAFNTVDLFDIGENAFGGLAMGHWSVRFDGDNIIWSVQDTVRIGTYSFIDSSSFNISFGSGDLSVFILSDEQLVIDSIVYERPVSRQFDSQQSLLTLLDGTSYQSARLLPIGETASGTQALGYWYVDFISNTFSWTHNDVSQAGRYSYLSDNIFKALLADTGYLIEIDGDDIIWIGERYIKQ